jgi:hypothetical protein
VSTIHDFGQRHWIIQVCLDDFDSPCREGLSRIAVGVSRNRPSRKLFLLSSRMASIIPDPDLPVAAKTTMIGFVIVA